MSELQAWINRHDHDPAHGGTLVHWECIEGKPEPGLIERVHTVEIRGINLHTARNPGAERYIRLPGAAYYNKGFGLTSLTEDNRPMIMGAEWIEMPRPLAMQAGNASTEYYSKQVRILQPKDQSIYRLTWRDRIITDYVRGLSMIRIRPDGLFAPAGAPTNATGIAWDALPKGYIIEIWRKTRQRARRWALWRTVPASKLGVNLVQLSRRSMAPCAYRVAYLRPDGTRSLLSTEAIIYRNAQGLFRPQNVWGGILQLK